MGRTSAVERWNFNYRRLVFGDIELVPFADRNEYPYNTLWNADMWHVPGRRYLSTDALVRLAAKRGLTVTLVERDSSGVVRTQLN